MKQWTIYPARPFTGLPVDLQVSLKMDFTRLKKALREEGFKLYESLGLDPKASCDDVNDFDLLCVEFCDLLLAIRPCPSDDVVSEIAWKCARQGHVIVAVPRGCTVSPLIKGWRIRNPNFVYVEYNKVLEILPVVLNHFERRADHPQLSPQDFRLRFGSLGSSIKVLPVAT